MRKYEFVINDNECTVQEYAEKEGIEVNSVYYRIKKGGLKARYAVPELELLLLVEFDSYEQKKAGRKKGTKLKPLKEKE